MFTRLELWLEREEAKVLGGAADGVSSSSSYDAKAESEYAATRIVPQVSPSHFVHISDPSTGEGSLVSLPCMHFTTGTDGASQASILHAQALYFTERTRKCPGKTCEFNWRLA